MLRFRNRVSEPWPNKYLKYVLMEWYIFRIERNLLPATWDCPLPGCNQHFDTFRDVITHLEDCRHLKPTTRQYDCPGCHTRAQVPAASVSPGHKAMLKITKSLENIRGQLSPRSPSSSAGASPTSSFSSDASLSQAMDQAEPMPFAAEKDANFPSQVPDLFIGKSRNVPMEKINTQFPVAQPYELYSKEPCLSSTTTNSAYGTGFSSPFSAQASSATSMSQHTVSPSEFSWIELPCPDGPNVFPPASNTQTSHDAQQFDGFPYQSTPFEVPQHAFSQDITNMQLDGANLEGAMSCMPLDSDTNVDFVGMKELQGKVINCIEEWTQHQSLFFDLPRELPQQHYINMHITAAPNPTHDFISPTYTDLSMSDTLMGSEGTSPTTNSQAPKCPDCEWGPDMTGNRSLLKLRQAVEKHLKRNHRSENHQCPFCSQSFKNRPDNVKPHIRRKHPEEFSKLYQNSTHDGSKCDKVPRRRLRRGVRNAYAPNEADAVAQSDNL